MPEVTVIYNLQSGSANLDGLRSALQSARINANYYKLSEFIPPKAYKSDVVVAAGGDGTVNAVAEHLIGTNASLGILPLGTLNHFAKDLGLPQALDEAVAVIKANTIKLVDVAQVNGHSFVNNSSIGLYPAMVRVRDKQSWGKWLGMAWGLLVALARHKRYQVALTVDNQETIHYRTSFVFIGNNSYGLDAWGISNRSQLDAGRLHIYIVKSQATWQFAILTLRSLFGWPHREKELEAYSGKTVKVSLPGPVSVALDGEVQTLTPPLEYKILPQSLRVIVQA